MHVGLLLVRYADCPEFNQKRGDLCSFPLFLPTLAHLKYCCSGLNSISETKIINNNNNLPYNHECVSFLVGSPFFLKNKINF